jgi:hypothetical protein
MTMDEPLNADQLSRQRKQAVKTAWVLGIIALAIFATFIGSAVIGR